MDTFQPPPRADGDGFVILEGIVTTINDDGTPHVTPMGPLVDRELTQFTLRPFRTATTYKNLKRTGECVFHVTDDVELLARAAVDRLESAPAMFPARTVQGFVLTDACRWFALRVRTLDDREERTTIECDVVDRGSLRDFFGFNRAKHAVVEAAILATRISRLPAEEIRAEFQRLAVIVNKTAGDQEHRAFQFLADFVRDTLPAEPV